MSENSMIHKAMGGEVDEPKILEDQEDVKTMNPEIMAQIASSQKQMWQMSLFLGATFGNTPPAQAIEELETIRNSSSNNDIYNQYHNAA